MKCDRSKIAKTKRKTDAIPLNDKRNVNKTYIFVAQTLMGSPGNDVAIVPKPHSN